MFKFISYFNELLVLYYQVEDDRVLLFLCKLQNKSWYPELENGLDIAEEEGATGQ